MRGCQEKLSREFIKRSHQEKSSIYTFTDYYYLLIRKTFPFGTLLNLQGLQDVWKIPYQFICWYQYVSFRYFSESSSCIQEDWRKSSIDNFTNDNHTNGSVGIQNVPLGTLLSCKGLLKKSPRDNFYNDSSVNIQNVSFRYLIELPRTPRSLQGVSKNTQRSLQEIIQVMVTLLSWWKNFQSLSLNY